MSECEPTPGWLLGRWRLQRSEQGLEILPGTCMEFVAGGELRYTVMVEGLEHTFELRYQVRGELLRTQFGDGEQQAEPRFCRLPDGLLELDFGGRRAWFRLERLM